jgi:hypothetical protein
MMEAARIEATEEIATGMLDAIAAGLDRHGEGDPDRLAIVVAAFLVSIEAITRAEARLRPTLVAALTAASP